MFHMNVMIFLLTMFVPEADPPPVDIIPLALEVAVVIIVESLIVILLFFPHENKHYFVQQH